MFHFDLHLFDAPGVPHQRYRQDANRLRKFAGTDDFAPDRIDVRQWVEAAAAMGARAAVMTACHENGLRLWRSDANPHSLKTTRWGGGKRDLVAEFAEACRSHGIRPGFFHCHRWNSLLRVHEFRVMKDSPLTQEQYVRMLEREVEELCSRYGPLFQLWFDGGALTPAQGGPDIVPLFERLQPDALFYHSDQRRDLRWAGNEGGMTGNPCWSTIDRRRLHTGGKTPADYLSHGDPDGPDFCPALADLPLHSNGGHEWFWEPGDERLILPLDRLMRCYESSVGRNATLVVGLTPDKHGLLPDADAARVREFGDEVRKRYGSACATTGGRGTAWELAVPAGGWSRIVLGENTAGGERIRRYVIEARRAGSDAWEQLAAGSSVGHKRIHAVPGDGYAVVRLRVTASAAEPELREFSLHRDAAG